MFTGAPDCGVMTDRKNMNLSFKALFCPIQFMINCAMAQYPLHKLYGYIVIAYIYAVILYIATKAHTVA